MSKEMRKLLEAVIMEDDQGAYRLGEIKDEIKDLLREAKNILQKTDEDAWEKAKKFWYGHIVAALDEEHGYLGSPSHTMQDTIDKLSSGNLAHEVNLVNDLMLEKGISLEDAVEEVSDNLDINYNELMAAYRNWSE